MSDFASAAMVRLLAEGMRRQGLVPPAGLAPPTGGGARVPLDLKRAVVQSAVAQGGLAVLPQLALGLQRFRDEPIHQALVNAHGAADLFTRWGRLERYIHSRHRVIVEQMREDADGGHARLRHTARHGPPPLPAESLVVLGVLAALMQELGRHDVQAAVDGAAVLPLPQADALAAAAQAGGTGAWALAWRTGPARPVAHPPTSPQSAAAAVAVTPALDTADWPPLAQQAARILARDLAAPPGVADLARQMACSTRSLQRALAQAGLSYSAVLAVVRGRAASAWLIHDDTPVAEVGFVCGYADQSHFTRDFRHRVGLPPAAFRAAFAAPGLR